LLHGSYAQVEAGLCTKPELWPWSSHAAVIAANYPSWLAAGRFLSYFASAGGDPLRRYLEFVAMDLKQPKGV
jgi:hypothetical protein